MISVWPWISARKHVGIIDSEPYCILCYLFCSTIINAVAVFVCEIFVHFLYYFLIFWYHCIHAHSLLRYSCFFFFFSANIDVTRYSSHNFNWGSACQRRCVLAVESTFQLASLSVNVYHLYSLCVCLCMTVCVLNV